MRIFIAGVNFFLLLITELATGQHKSSIQSINRAYTVTTSGGVYNVYMVSKPVNTVKMYWKDKAGKKLRSLGKLKQFLHQADKRLLFATNGGMYTAEGNPVGLYIENGKKIHNINLHKGPETNFYMQPNGVFYITTNKAGICISDSFARINGKVLYATQSGPMLVINGKINSKFAKYSGNINIRNAVGVDKEGRAYFVISQSLVNFYDIATLFVENLHCEQALFLDGSISRMYLPALNLSDTGGEFGVMIGVAE